MKRILIVEDNAETRRWLVDIVQTAFPEGIIDQAVDIRTGIAAARGDFDLALIDLGLPDGSGLEVLRQLKLANPKTVCVVATVMGEDACIVAALSGGADGYLLKEQPDDLLIRQLTQLTAGVPALSPSIARRLMEHFRRTGPVADPEGELTPREKEVLTLIGRGLRNAEVGGALHMAESTVASHIKAIYRKLGICSRAEAAWHATRLGLAGRSAG